MKGTKKILQFCRQAASIRRIREKRSRKKKRKFHSLCFFSMLPPLSSFFKLNLYPYLGYEYCVHQRVVLKIL